MFILVVIIDLFLFRNFDFLGSVVLYFHFICHVLFIILLVNRISLCLHVLLVVGLRVILVVNVQIITVGFVISNIYVMLNTTYVCRNIYAVIKAHILHNKHQ